MDWIKPYLRFRGRVNRKPYWLISLSLFGVYLVAFVLGVFMPVVGPVAAAIVIIGALWVALATLVRRLHDRGKGAWWLIPMYVPMLVLSVLALAVEGAGEVGAAAGLNALTLPFSIWVFIELGCLRGTAADNRFGPDPLDPSAVEVFDQPRPRPYPTQT